MTRPPELQPDGLMEITNGKLSTADAVWQMLHSSYQGDLTRIQTLASIQPELLYAQYNYTPPIHFAVREGHTELVRYLLQQGAYDPSYHTYPFQDSLGTIATERGHNDIVQLLHNYTPAQVRYSGDNGTIQYPRSEAAAAFEKAVDQNDLAQVETLLQKAPGLAREPFYFWGEGILMMPAKENHRAMIDLLLAHGASIPPLLKWAQFYYLEHPEGASYMLDKGMNPNTKSWQEVTLLHDMAQKGFIDKAGWLLDAGADINAIDDEYQSTPLGMAARWGHLPMVQLLLERGADPVLSRADWSTPLAWAKSRGHQAIQEILEHYY